MFSLEPLEVFCSYAPEDEELCRHLEMHLSILKRQGLLSLWHNRCIGAGTIRIDAIDAHLNRASIILLLVSSDFLGSDYCFGKELMRALERHEANEARVLPLLLRPVYWQDAPFAHLQVLPRNSVPITTWPDLDTAFATVVAEIRQVLEDLNPRTMNTTSSSLPNFWSIPYRRNPFFTGREALLEHLHWLLNANSIGAVTQTQAIQGLGGIGKTQVAVEYGYRYQHEYRYVFWVVAANRETLSADIVSTVDRLHLPKVDPADATEALTVFKRWLTTHQSWLLILDNADDLEVVSALLPLAKTGHILLTTRAQAVGPLAGTLLLGQMTEEEGALLLLRRARLLAADDQLAQASREDQEQAQAIVHVMGGLPLALDQAGAYIEETQCSLSSYLDRYYEHQRDLLQRRGQTLLDYPASVLTTWALSFTKIEQENRAAADLLQICTFLAPDDIPEEFFILGASDLGPALAPCAKDVLEFDKAIETILKFSLIQRNSHIRAMSIHRLVQAVLKMRMSQKVQRAWAEKTVRAMSRVFPEPAIITWPRCRRLLMHAQHCISLIEYYDWTFPEAVLLLKRTGRYLASHAQYQEAKRLYQHTLAIQERVLGAEHPETASTLHDLGSICGEQGRYKEAEYLYQRTLAIRERVLGVEHSDTASTLHNLGTVYLWQGRYKEALQLYRRALVIREQVLGTEHPETASTLHEQGIVYRVQGRYKEAERLHQRILAINEQTLGAEHPDTAQTLHNLGILYSERGFYKEAKVYLQRALATRERMLGAEHPSTAYTLHNLGNVHWRQGQYKEAEQLYRRALAMREQVLGTEHPDTAQTLHNLGMLYSDQGRYKEAERCYLQALTVYRQAFISNHRNIAYVLEVYALLLLKSGHALRATQIYTQAFKTVGIRRLIADVWEGTRMYTRRIFQKK